MQSIHTNEKILTHSCSKMLKLTTALQHNILCDCGHMQYTEIKANIYIKKN